MSNLIVVVDPDYGDRLGSAAQLAPVWVVSTPGNKDACQHFQETSPVAGHNEKGALTSYAVNNPEDRLANLLDILPTLEEHHGEMGDKDFTFPEGFILEVIGLSPTGDVTNALREVGFAAFFAARGGFRARM